MHIFCILLLAALPSIPGFFATRYKKPVQVAAAPATKSIDYKTAYAEYQLGGVPMLVVIGAEWCGPCLVLDANIKSLNLKNINYVHLDYDRDTEQVRKLYTGTTVPYVMYYKVGQPVKTTNTLSKNQILKFLE